MPAAESRSVMSTWNTAKSTSRSAWATVLVPAIALSLQHATLPLIFDTAFLAWRADVPRAFSWCSAGRSGSDRGCSRT